VRCSDQLAETISGLGIRYLMPERPGFGQSSDLPGRTVAGWARDVGEFADALGLERFSVVGVSAGAPYAIACAALLGRRIAATAAVSAMPPGFDPWRARGMSLRYRAGLGILRAHPGASIRAGDRILEFLRRHPGLLARTLASGAPRSDRRLLSEGEARDTAVRSFFEAARRGVRPMIEDYSVCSADWGFALAGVAGTVHVWHGAHDHLVPVAAARRLASALPDAELRISKQDGHFFFRSRLREIFAPLVAPLWTSPPTRLELAA
jgi:pimeloyl-ACP methyl ester carboxylesterase